MIRCECRNARAVLTPCIDSPFAKWLFIGLELSVSVNKNQFNQINSSTGLRSLLSAHGPQQNVQSVCNQLSFPITNMAKVTAGIVSAYKFDSNSYN